MEIPPKITPLREHLFSLREVWTPLERGVVEFVLVYISTVPLPKESLSERAEEHFSPEELPLAKNFFVWVLSALNRWRKSPERDRIFFMRNSPLTVQGAV